MTEKINNIEDAEIEYKQALKDYHKKSSRHVLVLEADVTEEQKRMILHTSNLIRIAGNCLTVVMKRNYEQLVRTKRYRNLKSLYKKDIRKRKMQMTKSCLLLLLLKCRRCKNHTT